MRLTLGFSPCPNDTFIFDALINGKIDTQGIDFDVVMEDVEALNRRAFAHELDVTKLSFHAFAHLTTFYTLLEAGSALGRNCGPLLVAKRPLSHEEVQQARIAIPGKMTTANFLLGLAYPAALNKEAVLFSDIEDRVVNGEFDAGLIIHENRFTYAQKGLVCIRDLGVFWESTTQLPIPLGGIVMKKALPSEVQQLLNHLMRQSVEFAFAHTESVMPFVRQHAQTMSDEVMLAHIGLYVNEHTIDLGEQGHKAVDTMFEQARQLGLLSK
jgi:1,4-dihydroxy-6-naphthoate synthase